MKKFCNLRLPVLMATSLALGIICAVLFAYCKIDGVWLLLPSSFGFLCCLLYGLIKKNGRASLIILSVTLFWLIGALYCSLIVNSYIQAEVYIDSAVVITGKVKSTEISSNGNRYLVLTDVSFGENKVDGNLVAYMLDSASGYCRRGFFVSFYAQPEQLSFISNGAIDYRAVQGIKYSCIVHGEVEAQYGFSLIGEINYFIQRLLYNNLDRETASVCFALLTGNTDMISQGTITAFRYGGIAHVFAVSGLHIGLVFGVLTFIFKKLRLNKYASAVARIAIITLYSCVCAFTASSVRAVVMCSVFALSSCIYRRYDQWNALSLSAIIILLINPLSFFGVGFALSYGAILGIILLSHNFRRVFVFLPKKLSSALAVGWSAQLSTAPILANSFGYVSIAGLVLNLIFIPIISVFYVILFTATLLSAVMPFASGFLLSFATTPISLLINLVTVFGFENSIFSGDYGYWLYVPFIIAVIGASDKFRMRLYMRGMLVFLSLTALFVASTSPDYGNGSSAMFGTGYSGAYLYINNSHGSILVVTQDISGIPQSLCDNTDNLVILGENDSIEAVFALGGDFKHVYMRQDIPPLPSFGDYEVVYSDSFTVCGVRFKYGDDFIRVETDGIAMAVVMAERGTLYGQLPDGVELCLYCYQSQPPVLIKRANDYNLSYCGKMKYILSFGEIFPSYAIPKE